MENSELQKKILNDKKEKNALILAPGPLNRGVEITPEVADGDHSAILDQVTNGVAVRMAALWCVLPRAKEKASAYPRRSSNSIYRFFLRSFRISSSVPTTIEERTAPENKDAWNRRASHRNRI